MSGSPSFSPHSSCSWTVRVSLRTPRSTGDHQLGASNDYPDIMTVYLTTTVWMLGLSGININSTICSFVTARIILKTSFAPDF